MSSASPDGAHAAHAHETRDLRLTPIVVSGVALLLLVTIAASAMLGLFDFFAAVESRLSPPANPLAAREGPRLAPEPRLQVDALRDIRELRAAEQEILTTYAWVDQGAGTARIPIARAMDILAERGGADEAAPR
jgi:hypothetical protein